MVELIQAVSTLIVAVGALGVFGGAGFYMVRRKTNGQSAIPDTHEPLVLELRAIRVALVDGNEANRAQHEAMLNVLAPRQPGGGA